MKKQNPSWIAKCKMIDEWASIYFQQAGYMFNSASRIFSKTINGPVYCGIPLGTEITIQRRYDGFSCRAYFPDGHRTGTYLCFENFPDWSAHSMEQLLNQTTRMM